MRGDDDSIPVGHPYQEPAMTTTWNQPTRRLVKEESNVRSQKGTYLYYRNGQANHHS